MSIDLVQYFSLAFSFNMDTASLASQRQDSHKPMAQQSEHSNSQPKNRTRSSYVVHKNHARFAQAKPEQLFILPRWQHLSLVIGDEEDADTPTCDCSLTNGLVEANCGSMDHNGRTYSCCESYDLQRRLARFQVHWTKLQYRISGLLEYFESDCLDIGKCDLQGMPASAWRTFSRMAFELVTEAVPEWLPLFEGLYCGLVSIELSFPIRIEWVLVSAAELPVIAIPCERGSLRIEYLVVQPPLEASITTPSARSNLFSGCNFHCASSDSAVLILWVLLSLLSRDGFSRHDCKVHLTIEVPPLVTTSQ